MKTPTTPTAHTWTRIANGPTNRGATAARWMTPGLLLLALCWLLVAQAAAAANTLHSVAVSSLPDDNVQISLGFSGQAPTPNAFTIDNPARIALDFPDTQSNVRQRSQDIGIGITQSVNIAATDGRTRVVVNLASLTDYKTEQHGHQLVLTIGTQDGTHASRPAEAITAQGTSRSIQSTGQTASQHADGRRIINVDFRRGEDGEGRVLIRLSNANIPVDLREQGGKILVDFANTGLPTKLEQRLDVLDFATPVKSIETFSRDDGVRMIIRLKAGADYDHLAYQSDNLYVVEVSQVPEKVREQRKKEQFTGERLSLNFQDIEVRSVLQLIADFTGLNIVVSDTVSGNLTLRLKNVPWDQALDIILKTKGLDKRRTGNVLLIAPSEEIAAREKLELESRQQVQDLAPLRSEYIQVNYARAADLAELMNEPDNSLLSERGNVSVDARTNTLLVQDTAAKLAEIRGLVERLDIPVKQVLIESRVVVANDDFSKELGVRFGASNFDSNTSGNDDDISAVTGNLNGFTDFSNGDDIQQEDTLNVNLPAANPAGQFGIALAKLPLGTLLELELSAAQAESRAEVISTPRVITSNQATARIEQGTEIPFQEASSSGATSTSFKDAVLSLEVTPQITPDDRVAMELSVNNDTVGQIFNGVPSIDTSEVTTQVLVDNGQTVVLGGIYQEDSTVANRRVPFFSDIPLVGRLFRNDTVDNSKSELLVFITPKIIREDLSLAR